MNFTNNSKITPLPIPACLLLDLPDTRIDCSFPHETECVRCRFLGRFFTGEGVDDFGSPGHIMCIILLVITLLVGIGGALGNILIITILQRRRSSNTLSFDLFLKALAVFDFICCICCVIVNSAVVIYYENLNRGIGTLYFYWLAGHTSLFAKSLSSFLTVTITVERYTAIAFMSSSTQKWVNHRRTYILILAVFLFSLMLAIPRYSSIKIGENTAIGKTINATKDVDHIILASSLFKLWYVTMKGFFNQIDFWLPLPLLLLFNGLVYMHILKYSKRRQDLNMGQRKEIRAVKMFFPVVIVLFLCNIEPIIHYAFIVSGVAYRELDMGMRLSFAFNSAVNLPIYYYRGTGFRQETKAALVEMFPVLEKWVKNEKKKSAITSSSGQQITNTSVNETSMTTMYVNKQSEGEAV